MQRNILSCCKDFTKIPKDVLLRDAKGVQRNEDITYAYSVDALKILARSLYIFGICHSPMLNEFCRKVKYNFVLETINHMSDAFCFDIEHSWIEGDVHACDTSYFQR